MVAKTFITPQVLMQRIKDVVIPCIPEGANIYGIPRGGIPVSYLVMAARPDVRIVTEPEDADVFIDDLIDSGNTMARYCDEFPEKPFLAPFDKRTSEDERLGWLVFPWEAIKEEDDDDSIVATIRHRIEEAGESYLANDNISEFLQPGDLAVLQVEVEKRLEAVYAALLIDTQNDHNTRETAKRVAKLYLREVFSGRYVPMPKVTSFPNAKQLDELCVTGPISIRSACSHHMAPILGQCWIGFIPGDKVIGLSKFNRVVDWVASRPQIQEELAIQIADAIEGLCQPTALAVVIKAGHTCMTWRGVKEVPAATFTTSVMRGDMRYNAELRAEFLSLIEKT